MQPSALLISKFPPSFNEKIASHLSERGIKVSRIIHPAKVSENLSFEYDYVFLLFEMISHSEFYRIRNLAKRYNKEIIPLQRKVSGWSFPMAAKRLTPADSTEHLIKKFIELRNLRVPMSEIAFSLVKEGWGTKSPNGKNLNQFMHGLANSGSCPGHLRDELKAALSRYTNVKNSASNNGADSVVVEADKKPIVDVIPPDNYSAIPANPASASEWEELAHSYASENETLRKKNIHLQDQIKLLRSEVERMQGDGRNEEQQALIQEIALHISACSNAVLRLAGLTGTRK